MTTRSPAMPACHFGVGSTIAHAPLSLAGRLFYARMNNQLSQGYINGEKRSFSPLI
jgi:hypothetical protein